MTITVEKFDHVYISGCEIVVQQFLDDGVLKYGASIVLHMADSVIMDVVTPVIAHLAVNGVDVEDVTLTAYNAALVMFGNVFNYVNVLDIEGNPINDISMTKP